MAIQVTKRPSSKCFSGNPVHYQLYSTQAAADTSIFFEVRVQFKSVGGTYTDLVTLPYYPTGGFADIDIKDILHSQMEYGVPPFQDDEKQVWEAGDQTGWFYLEFREITTSSADPSWDSSEAGHACFVVKGGLNYFAYRGNNYWVNYFPVQQPFFTWQKSGRMASASERMYLAWLCDTDSTALTVSVRAYYTDGTTSANQTKAFIAAKGLVYYIPSGCTQWGLASLAPAKNIWYWTVQVKDGSTIISELFTYLLDNRNDDNDVTLHYRNSLGGLDSVRVRGVIEDALTYNYTEQETTSTPDYFSGDTIQPQRRITDSLEQLSHKGDIGHLGKEEQDRLRDAFLQREVLWEVSRKWWPVILTNKTAKLRSTLDNRWTMPIEWELGISGAEYYTPLSILGALADGVFTDNVCRAMVSPVNVTVDISGSDAALTIAGTEVDPQNASSQFRYRFTKNGVPVADWMTVAYSALPLSVHLAKGFLYQLETQAICTNNVYGSISSTFVDTLHTTTPPVGSTYNSAIINHTNHVSNYTLVLNGNVFRSGTLGANNAEMFDAPDHSGIYVELILQFMPASAQLNGAEGSFASGEVIWVGVTYTNGFTINLY